MSADYIIAVAILAGINLMTVLGLSVLTGYTGLFSFGHAGFMAIGAYCTAFLANKFHLPFYVAILIGGLLSGLVSIGLGKLTLNLKGDYFVIATLGFGESVRLFIAFLEPLGGSRGINVMTHRTTLVDVLIICTIAVVLVWNLIHSKHGQNLKAIREEEMAAKIIGVNTFYYKMLAFFISALLAGISGGLWAGYQQFIQPIMFDLLKSTELTIMVIFGGLGSISGSIIGALFLTFLPEVLRDLKVWRFVIYGLLVVLIMVARPKGLMGGMEFNDFFKRKKKVQKGESK
ncbi:branched-chain amino acid ABC transporter permease [Guggenheimella bovis]